MTLTSAAPSSTPARRSTRISTRSRVVSPAVSGKKAAECNPKKKTRAKQVKFSMRTRQESAYRREDFLPGGRVFKRAATYDTQVPYIFRGYERFDALVEFCSSEYKAVLQPQR